LDDDVQAADLLQEYEAKIAALERMVGRQALEIELGKMALCPAARGAGCVRASGGPAGDGITIILVEQNVAASLKLADQGHALENGRIVLSGNGAALLDDPGVQQAFGAVVVASRSAGFRTAAGTRRCRRRPARVGWRC
jgi:branched-chain amino acid transport system ATP-binding protein